MRRLHRKGFFQDGFSLIELLVVVAIIGILAAVGVVAYSGYTQSASVAKTGADIKAIRTAADMIRMSTGYWPGSSWPENPGVGGSDPNKDPLSCYCDGGNTFVFNNSGLIANTWMGPYMTSWPKNAMGGTYYWDFNESDQNGDGFGHERVLWIDNGRGNRGHRFPDDLKLQIDERFDDGNLRTGMIQVWQGSNMGMILYQGDP